jgi:hypothetical protein
MASRYSMVSWDIIALQANLVITQTLVSLWTYWHVLLKAWQKHEPYQGIVSAREAHLTIKVRAHATVDKLPPSYFT